VAVSKDFEELFACLNAHAVDALIVGGYAVAFHAKPRYTKDIDVLVSPSADNAQRLLDALADFGFGDLGLTLADFTRVGNVVQLGYPPNRIDLLTTLTGVTFAEAWPRRVQGRYGEQPVWYIDLDTLIRNKEATGRPQDIADAAALKAARTKPTQ